MVTDVDIVNAALIKLGERTIASLSDAVKPALLANAIYADLRDALLREHPWNFAVVRTSLAVPASLAPGGRYGTAYMLPDGGGGAPRCLRLLGVEDSGGRYLDHQVDAGAVIAPGQDETVNQLAVPNDLTDGVWSSSGGTVASAQAAAPFGFGLADEILDTSGSATAFVEQVVSGTGDGTIYAASCFVRPGSVPAAYATLELQFTGGATEITGCYVEIGFADGVLSFRDPAGTVLAYERERLVDGWYRLSLVAANNLTGNDMLTLRIHAGGLATGDPADQLSVFVAAPQVVRPALLPVTYVAQVTDPDRMEPLFRETLAARLAMDLAEPLGKSTALQQTMTQLYRDKLRTARSADGQEGTHGPIETDGWLRARG